MLHFTHKAWTDSLIFQVALCSTKTEKGGAMTLGVLAIIAAVILAFFAGKP
jgi:hypothetical protein